MIVRIGWKAFCIVAVSCQMIFAQPPAPSGWPSTFDLAAIDAAIASQLEKRQVVGLSVAIARDGQLVLAKGYGRTELPDGPKVTADTAFGIGSITKQFVCACILMLAEEGKLSIHDSVDKYFPKATRAGDVTLYDLMTHVSGYPDYYPLDFLDRRMKQAIAHDELIRQYAGGKLDFEPKSRWSYSNTGYIILGRVVEIVSGESFGNFLQRRIFKPLAMDHSSLEPSITGSNIARGYASILLGPSEAVPLESPGWLHGAGGIFASAPDLTRWNLALMAGKVLKPESMKIMTQPRELSNGKIQDYGCGLSVSRQSGDTIWGHSGAVSGYHAYSTMIPRTKSSVVVFSNAEHTDAAALHRELLAILIRDQSSREVSIPKVNGPPAKDAALAFFKQLQTGKIDRSKLGEEFDVFLSEQRVRESAPRLSALGDPNNVTLESTSERGGMESARLRMNFDSGTVRINMFRSPDGKIQQFLLSRGD